MHPNIIADECVDFRIITALRMHEFDVISIMEEYRSLRDDKILELATARNALIITEDNDFGEWIFAHHKESTGVIFLRYDHQEINEIIHSLLTVLRTYEEELYNKFAVIRTNKIRIRNI